MNFLPNYVYSGTVRDFLPRLVIGILIGTALHKTATSFVDDVLMGPIGMLTHKRDISQMFIDLSGHGHHSVSSAKAAGDATLNYGAFLNSALHLGVSTLLALPFILYLKRKLRKAEEQLEDAVARGLIEPKLMKVRRVPQPGEEGASPSMIVPPTKPLGASAVPPLQMIIPTMSGPMSAPVSAEAISINPHKPKPLPLSALDDPPNGDDDPLVEKKTGKAPKGEPTIQPYQPKTKLTPQFMYPEPVVKESVVEEKEAKKDG